ncbi:MAG: Transcriptional regulatory protein ZraR [Calditrichaeota bacterium]|nr:Transcriptional regulatory protein ZraR [Calditrichota bacterium]
MTDKPNNHRGEEQVNAAKARDEVRPGPVSSASTLEALLRISRVLSSILEGPALLRKVLEIAMEAVQAQRGFVVLTSDGGDGWSIAAAANLSDEEAGRIAQPSSRILRRAMNERVPLLVHDARTDPRFEGSESVIMQQITAAIAVPMMVRDKLLGIIYVDSRQDRSRFSEENLDFFRVFAVQAGLAYVNAARFDSLREKNLRLQTEMQRMYGFPEIIGVHPKMQNVFTLMRKILNSDISVLLLGESGTGKELVARALHYNGPRREKPFVTQFCGNLSETLLESELFGHKRGSFTGALHNKRGLMEVADGGTFFLDEIADISPTIQTKLLRVLQDGAIRRVGGTETLSVDLRIISATNKDLKREVDEGRFREDLYYRLNVITVELPPLRERLDDIPLLAEHFLKRAAKRNGRAKKTLSPEAEAMMKAHEWPGNVRELENAIERAVVLAGERAEILLEDLLISDRDDRTPRQKTLREHEREIVLSTLENYHDNKTRTAEALGVSLRWLHYRLKEWQTNE